MNLLEPKDLLIAQPVGKLIVGESIDAYIDDLHAKAELYGKDKTFKLSLPNKEFDIKTQYPGHKGFSYHGFLFCGKYVTLREADNILAGMNTALFGMEFDDFQKGWGIACWVFGALVCIKCLVEFIAMLLSMEKMAISIREVYMDIISS